MSDEYNDCLICPITCSIFEDPVIAEDGHTYERKAITNWIERDGTSPLTRTSITIGGLRPNLIVRKLVEEFRHAVTKHQCKFKLGVDIERSPSPFFQTIGKSIYDARWSGYPNGPPVILLKLSGAQARKEASYYEQLTRHPHIVYTYGLVGSTQAKNVMLLQEKAPEGNLAHFLEHRAENQPNQSIGNLLLNHVFLQVTEAMIHLSEKKIVHGDLACRNVLVFHMDENQPERTLVKLTDFGISCGETMFSKIDAAQTALDIIPIRTTAPEVFEEHLTSEKSDMYAMGVLMWEAFSNGDIPWGEIAKESVIRKKVINGERLSRPTNCKSDRQWDLLLKCMSQQAEDRPTFRELKDQLNEFLTPNIQPTSTSKSSIADPPPEIQLTSVSKSSIAEPPPEIQLTSVSKSAVAKSMPKIKLVNTESLSDEAGSQSSNSSPRASLPTKVNIKDRCHL